MSRDATLYIDDMIEACRRVAQYTEGLERAQFVSGTMAHDAVLRNLEVLGEAAKRVPSAMRQMDDAIVWRRIAGLRDVLAHAYFGIDDDIVWSVSRIPAASGVPQRIWRSNDRGSSGSLLPL